MSLEPTADHVFRSASRFTSRAGCGSVSRSFGNMTLPDIPDRYILSAVRPDWADLLVHWQSLIPAQTPPWLLTKFGEIFFCHPDGKIGMLQVGGFRYEVVARDKIDFQEWLVDPDKMSEWFLAPLVDQLECSGRTLGPDQCYSFIQVAALGGSLSADNVTILSVSNHFLGWGKVFRQVGGLTPGTQFFVKQP